MAIEAEGKRATGDPVAGARLGPTYLLKFVSGKYQGGEFVLPHGREVVLGRARDADMVLMEDMVSRRHARIFMAGGDVNIEDLGSTNGTFVNGEKIGRASLREGDRVLVGTSVLKLVRQGGDASAKPRLSADAQRTLRPQSMAGSLTERSLADTLRMLIAAGRNVCVAVRGPRTGRIVLKDGKIVFASIEGLPDAAAKKALYRLLSYTEGDYSVELLRGNEPVSDDLDEAPEALLAEGLRQVDEVQRARERLGRGRARFVLTRPLAASLKDLSARMLDTLQLVWNHAELDAILDHHARPDLEVLKHLAHFLEREYIQIER